MGKNDKGVYIKAKDYDNKSGTKIDFYDKDPRDSNHKSIHAKVDYNNKSFKIVDNVKGEKETTSGNCYLTTACMQHFQENFDDNCEELAVIRKFRDKFVPVEDIDHYYKTAPIILEAINNIENNNSIYDYIYQNIIKVCVIAIKNGDYEFAYNRYKSGVITLEEQFAKPALEQKFIKVLKRRLN